MRPDSKAYLTSVRCDIPTHVTASQFATLSALPDPVEPVTPHLVCELAAGHEDDHAALVVASHGGDRWWWVRWGRQRHVVAHIDPCPVTEPEALDSEFCLLPAGHSGSHSFDVRPWPARNVVDGTLRPDSSIRQQHEAGSAELRASADGGRTRCSRPPVINLEQAASVRPDHCVLPPRRT
jgi:hypothetical protein